MTSTSLLESEWLAPKHSLQTPRLLDPYPAQATPDVPTESRGSPGFLSKRGISALSVLQKTKDVSCEVPTTHYTSKYMLTSTEHNRKQRNTLHRDQQVNVAPTLFQIYRKMARLCSPGGTVVNWN